MVTCSAIYHCLFFFSFRSFLVHSSSVFHGAVTSGSFSQQPQVGLVNGGGGEVDGGGKDVKGELPIYDQVGKISSTAVTVRSKGGGSEGGGEGWSTGEGEKEEEWEEEKEEEEEWSGRKEGRGRPAGEGSQKYCYGT